MVNIHVLLFVCLFVCVNAVRISEDKGSCSRIQHHAMGFEPATLCPRVRHSPTCATVLQLTKAICSRYISDDIKSYNSNLDKNKILSFPRKCAPPPHTHTHTHTHTHMHSLINIHSNLVNTTGFVSIYQNFEL